MTHFYEAGCAFFDLDTGTIIPPGSYIGTCRGILADAPPSCGDDVDEFLICLATVPVPAAGNADCDCSAAQEGLLTCG